MEPPALVDRGGGATITQHRCDDATDNDWWQVAYRRLIRALSCASGI
jgi:hypothetical protein